MPNDKPNATIAPNAVIPKAMLSCNESCTSCLRNLCTLLCQP